MRRKGSQTGMVRAWSVSKPLCRLLRRLPGKIGWSWLSFLSGRVRDDGHVVVRPLDDSKASCGGSACGITWFDAWKGSDVGHSTSA